MNFQNQAQEILNPSFLKRFLTTKEERYENALVLYKKALVEFKKEKDYESIKNVYGKIAACHDLLNNKWEAADALVEINRISQSSDDYSEENMLTASEIYRDLNNFHKAGRIMSEMASHMKEFGFNEKALKYFRKALDDFSISKNAIDKSKTKELIADLMFEMDMEEATNYYQTLLDENLVPEKLIYGKAEKYLIQLVICLLSNDDGVEAMVQLNDFPKQSQMIEVLKNIVQAYNDRDAGKFVNAIKDGEDIKRWNNQQVSKLLSIKKRIEPEEISLC